MFTCFSKDITKSNNNNKVTYSNVKNNICKAKGEHFFQNWKTTQVKIQGHVYWFCWVKVITQFVLQQDYVYFQTKI